MDRQTLDQLDRIEYNTHRLLMATQTEMQLMVLGFFEEEIKNPHGRLHHLNEDKEVQQFFKELQKEQEDDEEQDTEEEYTNTPLHK